MMKNHPHSDPVGACRRVRRKRTASSISEDPAAAMPPGQWRYLPVGEKF